MQKGGGKAEMQKYRVNIVELKKIMVEQNLDKIIELSAASGVNRNTLSQILNDSVRPSTSVIERLMLVLHIPPERVGAIFFSPELLKT